MKEEHIRALEYVNEQDPELGLLINRELHRQCRNIGLIASENYSSPAVISAMGSILTNKYAEGTPGNRYYGGCDCVDEVENLAIERAKKLFGCEFANVQPHSGAQANLAVYAGVLQPGDTIVGMDLACGGHLTHGAPVNLSGKVYHAVRYGVDPVTGWLDYNHVEDVVKQNKPKILVAGASSYPRELDFSVLADIAHRNNALLMVDMAHISGLVAGGAHMSPVPYADVVTTTTHKTLRGPRGGMILAKEEFGSRINSGVFPGTQGGPLLQIIASKAVCFREAMDPSFRDYARQIVSNAKALAEALKRRGLKLVTDGTDNHLMTIDLREWNITGLELQLRLDDVYITANKNAIPGDPQKPKYTSGLRVGTPAVTTRGMKEEHMDQIAEWIYRAITDYDASADEIRSQVQQMSNSFPIY